MKTSVAIDVSGLAWRYRTGVQNLYWAFVNAWTSSPVLQQRYDLKFYDRSGCWNAQVADAVGDAYVSSAPSWWPQYARRPLQAAIRSGLVRGARLSGCVNHVWNWSIYQPRGARASITIPDVLPLEYPQWFDERFQRLTKESLRFASEEAEFVFAISEFVKQRVMETTGMPEARIKVVYPGIEPRYFLPSTWESSEVTLKKYGLVKGGFLLSSGFLDPRKNLARQVEAFKRYVASTGSDIKYALTGLKNSLSDELLKLIDSSELRSRIVFLGYVPQDELKVLMQSSAAVMYCSIAEGFGLPIIEAMAVGAPVITSATTSMRELALGRVRTVDPQNCDDIAAAIHETLSLEPQVALERIRRNQEFAAGFTIENWLAGHLKAMDGSNS